MVPLSDHEQKILEEIEKNLYAEDPEFARGVKRRSPRMGELRRARFGSLTFVAGIALLVAFFVSMSPLVGLAAFGAMVGGIVLVAGSLRVLLTRRTELAPTWRERMARAIDQWERRFRQRYRRH